MGWVVTAALARLMADFRTTFPNKDRSSDGTIGDAAHQAETSGHNPDDTVGSRAEYTDADSLPEVRAIDVDNDLNDPRGVTMQQVIDRMLQTPADLRRLRYIIYNRQIWSRNTSWQPRPYTGTSPHTEHAHFSGDPDTDADGAPWLSVLSFQEDDMLADERQALMEVRDRLRWVDRRIEADAESWPTYKDPGGVVTQHRGVQERKAIAAAAADLQGRPAYDAAALAAVLTDHLGVEVSADQLVAALESDAGQAALVKAANAAEDS